MSKFHSTVSRRTFMKGLGLGAAGLGAAAAAAPAFNDLDELASSPQALWEQPWWIKELEPNTSSAEIDWSIMPAMGTPPGFTREYQSASAKAQLFEIHQEVWRSKINEPGYTVRDWALKGAAVNYARSFGLEKFDSLFGPDYALIETPEELGVPRWQGTPEENSLMIRAAFRYIGADAVGIYELNADTRRTMFDITKYRFEDVDQPYKDGSISVIPNKCKYLISYLVRMPEASLKRGIDTVLSDVSCLQGYSRRAVLRGRLNIFMREIGYLAPMDTCLPVPSAVLTGLGEQGRLCNLVSPIYGPGVRITPTLVTDLPLAPTNPIDSGIFRFCKTCKLCAEVCPGGALNLDTEPNWDIYEYEGKPMNRTGVKCFRSDYAKCWPYRGNSGGRSQGKIEAGLVKAMVGMQPSGCASCIKGCPFQQIDKAAIHQVLKATLATTPVFNGFFANMHSFFSFGPDQDPLEWWNINQPVEGLVKD